MGAIRNCSGSASYDSLSDCLLDKELQSQFNWEQCEEYEFDRYLRSNSTTTIFDKGSPWETAVTQFGFVCDQEWIIALTIAFQVFGDFLGACIAGTYTDRFGRKNAIVIWTSAVSVLVMAQAFVTTEAGYLFISILLGIVVVSN